MCHPSLLCGALLRKSLAPKSCSPQPWELHPSPQAHGGQGHNNKGRGRMERKLPQTPQFSQSKTSGDHQFSNKTLTCKCASCHNVHFLDIWTSTIAAGLLVFEDFDFQTCFMPLQRAIFAPRFRNRPPHPPLFRADPAHKTIEKRGILHLCGLSGTIVSLLAISSSLTSLLLGYFLHLSIYSKNWLWNFD